MLASITLAVLPHNLTNQYGNNAVGSAADGDSIWIVVNLDGTHEENIAKVNAVAVDEPYVKYVLQVDWPSTEYIRIHGQHIILDLHGHTLNFVAGADILVDEAQTQILEVTDSSAAGNGLLDNVGVGAGIFDGAPSKYLIVSGGTIQGSFNGYAHKNVLITGGRILMENGNYPFNVNVNLYLAPYVTLVNNEFQTQANPQHAAFAISQSDQWCGAYNYTYGTAWDLAAGDCILEKITEDRPYYLWYRDNDREWYHLLTAL